MPGLRTSRAFKSKAGAAGYYIDPLTGMVMPLPSAQQEQQEQQPQGMEALYNQGFQLPGDPEEALEQQTSGLEQLYDQATILNPDLIAKEQAEAAQAAEEPAKTQIPFGPSATRDREGMTTRGPGTGYIGSDYTWGSTFEMPQEQPEILNPNVGRPTMRGERTLTEGTARLRGGGGGAINTGRPAPREQGARRAPRRARETRASLFKRYEDANAAGLLALKQRPASNLLGYPGGRRRNTLLGG